MTAPLFDPTGLREMTDGDPTIEQALLKEFEGTLDRCLHTLSAENASEQWRATLHELKGASASMGAMALAEACRMGEADNLDRKHYLYALHKLARETREALGAEIAK